MSSVNPYAPPTARVADDTSINRARAAQNR